MAAAWLTGNRGFHAGGASTLDTGSIACSGTDRYMVAVAFIGTGATPVDPTSVVWDPTGTNQALTSAQAGTTFATNFRGNPWALLAPTATTAVCRATWAASHDETMLICDVATGVDQATPERTRPSPATGTSTSPAITITSVSGDLCFAHAVCGNGSGAATDITVASPFTISEKVVGSDIGGYEQCASAYATASGTSTTATFTASETPVWYCYGVALIPATGGAIVVGQATENDTAQPMTVVVPIVGAIGQATETDSAQALYSVDFGQDEDLFTFGDDTGDESSMGGLRLFGGYPAAGGATTITIGQPSEADTAQALTTRLQLAIGQPSETDSAQALTVRVTQAIGQPTETDTAQPLTGRLALTAGQALETDSAQPMSARLLRTLGQPSEADTAQPLTAALVRVVGQVVETDTAQPLSALLSSSIGQALETDTAQPMAPSVPGIVGQAVETDTAQAFIADLLTTIGQPAEADTAQPLTLGGLGGSIGQATETDAAQAFVARLLLSVGQPMETDTAQPLTFSAGAAIGQPSELDTALALAQQQLRAIGIAVEFDTALAFSPGGAAGTSGLVLINGAWQYKAAPTAGDLLLFLGPDGLIHARTTAQPGYRRITSAAGLLEAGAPA